MFSTTTPWPVSSPIFLANMRAVVSVPLPAGNGTMKRMGREGKASSAASAGSGAMPAASAAAASPRKRRRER
nr:hypothetical protein [Cupriavidus sp. AcVe19-6a]